MNPSLEGSLETQLLTIGALAKVCGVTVRTLRYYEEMDLIGPVKRSSGQYRLYNHRSLKRVRAILALQDLNYPLERILAMLGPYTEGLVYSKEQRIDATRQSLALQKDLIQGKLVSLQEVKQDIENRLETLHEHCQPCYRRLPHQNCHDSCEYRDIHLS